VRDPSKHSPEDKLRLVLCFYFSSLASGSDKALSKDDLGEYERALADAGCDMGPWEFAKRLRDVMRMSSLGAAPAQPVAGGAGGDLMRGFSSLSNRVRPSLSLSLSSSLRFSSLTLDPLLVRSQLTDRLRESGVGGVGLDNLISGVKNFLPQRKDFPVTRLVEALMDPSSASTQALQDTDDYLLFDPRAGGRSARPAAATQGRGRQQYADAVVFVVGGGSLVEYGNLGEYVQRSVPGAQGGGVTGGGGAPAGATGGTVQGTPTRRVTYGSTEILTPSEFVKALGNLARSG